MSNSTQSNSTTAATKPAAQHNIPQTVLLVPYPKIVFLYPTFIMALLAGIITSFLTAPVDHTNSTAVAVGTWFLAIFTVNLVILAFDFPRATSLTLFFAAMAVVLGLVLICTFNPHFLGAVGDVLKHFRPVANASFYWAVVVVLGALFVVVLIDVRFDYWEVRPNELLHHHGFLSNLERLSAPNLRMEKEINDVFEYMLLQSGRLIIHTADDRRAIVLDNVPFIRKKEEAVTRMLARCKCKCGPTTPRRKVSGNMHYVLIAISTISLVCQAIVAVLALRLIRVTGASRAWLCVAAAMFLIALWPIVELVKMWSAGPARIDPVQYWLCGVEISVAGLLLAGFAGIAPVFRIAIAAHEATQIDRDELEQLVQQRTADLLSMNTQLAEQIEFRKTAQAAQREEQRHLQQVLEMYERDHQLVAYEIHDGFVQQATGALMSFQAALAQIAGKPEQAQASTAQGIQMLQVSIAEARAMMSGLRPSILDDFGVIATVDQLVRESQLRTGVPIEWTHEVEFDRLAPPLELALFRMIQESMTNALRHSKSERISIDLRQRGDTIHLAVQDWGVGFDRSAVPSDRFGLRGIEERARVFGGRATIESRPGGGTCVLVEMPVVRRETNEASDA